MIADRFPAQFEQEPVKPRMASLTESLFETPKQETTKIPPWSSGFNTARDRTQRILTPAESEKPGVRSGKFLPNPGTLRFYKVQGTEVATEAVTPNPSLTAFKPGTSVKPTFDHPEEMAKAHEVAMLRQARITNALDWQCAAAASLTLEMAKHNLSDRAKEKLRKVTRILKSAGKSIAQLEQEQTVTLANSRLRRRDAYLKGMGQVPEHTREKLRTVAVSDKRLFEETALQAALTSTREDASAKSNLKTVQLVDKLSSSSKKTDYKKPQQHTSSERFRKPQQKSQSHSSSSRSFPQKKQERFSGKAPQRAGRGGGHS